MKKSKKQKRQEKIALERKKQKEKNMHHHTRPNNSDTGKMENNVMYAVSTKQLLETISPLMPTSLWGTAEEAVKRQNIYNDKMELLQMLVIGLVMQNFRQEHPYYTDTLETSVYMRLIKISSGVMSKEDKPLADSYINCVKSAKNIIKQHGLAVESVTDDNDEKGKAEVDDGVTSGSAKQPPENDKYVTDAETLAKNIFKNEFGRTPTDTDKNVMAALVVKADSDIQFNQNGGNKDTLKNFLYKLDLLASYLCTVYNEKPIKGYSNLIQLRLNQHIREWNQNHHEQSIKIKDVFKERNKIFKDVMAGKVTHDLLDKTGIFAFHCMTPKECIEFHNKNLKDLTPESIEKILEARKFIR